MTTFQSLRQKCAFRFTDPSNAVVADLASSTQRNWQDYINQAYSEVLRASQYWPWNESSEQTITVNANTRGATLPTDTFNVNWVYDTTNDRRVIPDDGRGSQYRGGYQLRSTTAQVPETYKIRNNTIELYPTVTVNTVLVAECVICPVALSANGDVPAFPSAYHDVLIDGALAFAYLDDASFDEYNLLWPKFQKAIDQMKANLLASRSETYPVVRDAFWG